MKIKKVVVIGSGTMGSGIAAHLCNANIPVTLLDLKTEISEQARDKIYKSRPPLLLDKSKIKNIKVAKARPRRPAKNILHYLRKMICHTYVKRL